MLEQEAREHTARLRRQIQEQGTEITALKVCPPQRCEAKCMLVTCTVQLQYGLQLPIEQATSALSLRESKAQSVLSFRK